MHNSRLVVRDQDLQRALGFRAETLNRVSCTTTHILWCVTQTESCKGRLVSGRTAAKTKSWRTCASPERLCRRTSLEV